MRSSGFSLATWLLATVASSTAFAGVYLESTQSGAEKATPKVSKLWFDGGRMRSESTNRSRMVTPPWPPRR